MASKDPQATKVYDAEDELMRRHEFPRFSTLGSAAGYASEITTSEWWQAVIGPPVEMWAAQGDNRRSASAVRDDARSAGVVKLVLPPWAWHQLIVLHEVAHLATDRRYGDPEGHGPLFCGMYVALIDWAIHPHMANRLAAALVRNGCSINRPDVPATAYVAGDAPLPVDRINGAIAL